MSKFEVVKGFIKILLWVFLSSCSAAVFFAVESGTINVDPANGVAMVYTASIALVCLLLGIGATRELIVKDLAANLAPKPEASTGDEDYKPALKQAYAEYMRRLHNIKALMEDACFSAADYAEAEQMAQDAINGEAHEAPVS